MLGTSLTQIFRGISSQNISSENQQLRKKLINLFYSKKPILLKKNIIRMKQVVITSSTDF